MREHALTDRDFAELGAGRPSRRVIDELRRGERSRNLLLVRATGGSETDVDDPLFGAWAAARLRGRITGPAPAARRDTTMLTAEHDKITFRVRLEDRDERRGLLGLAPSVPLNDLEVKHWQECLAAAWRLLVTRHRAAARLLADVVTCVVPVESDDGAGGISATSADAFGAVAISRPADAAGFAVGLLHEAQHSLLNATAHLFDLHLEPGERGYSPWRDDPRPAAGILHGAYAYLAVTRFWRTEARATGEPLAVFEFCRWREAVADTAERLLAGGRLTAAGRRFVGALRDEVRPWVAEEVEPRITHLARLANDDHYARWRIRNMRPDVGALLGAFRHGEPAPVGASRLVADGERALSHSPRLVAIHNLLRGGAAVDNAAELSEASATLAPTQNRGGGGGGPRDTHKIKSTDEGAGLSAGKSAGAGQSANAGLSATKSATTQTRETRVAAVEAALLAGDYGTIPHAYPGKDPDLELTPLIIAAGVTTRAEEVVALARAGCEPLQVIRWIVG